MERKLEEEYSKIICGICNINPNIDFMASENFCKLFDSPIEDNIRIDSVCDWLQYLQCRYINKEQFIFAVLWNLQSKSAFYEEIIISIKKSFSD